MKKGNRKMGKKYNYQVEGLRGLALFMVLVYHFFYQYFQLYPVNNYTPFPFLRYWGMIGVAIFFAISGYYFEKSTGGIYLIKKRLLKLWPAYFCAITLIFIFTRRIGLPGRTVSFENYLLNIPFINGFLSKPYVDGAHWFLTTLVGCLICYSIIIKWKIQKEWQAITAG